MSKSLYIRVGEKLDVAQTYIRIEDDLLEALSPLSSAEATPQVWNLCSDYYADAEYTPETAQLLARELRQLETCLDDANAPWASALARLAETASNRGQSLIADAD